MRLLKKYGLSIVFALLAMVCAAAFNSAGSYVDEHGILHEQFGFIVIGWVLLLLAVISFCITYWRAKNND